MNKLSSIEHNLTLHIREYLRSNYSNDTIKAWSFCVSLITCLFEASIVTFSLFTPQFMTQLKYSQVDINVVSGFMMIGCYLTPPILGYLSDAHGPVLLALIGMLLSPGYILASASYARNWSYIVMAIAFFIIGAGTSSAYFCSLLTCAKIYPERKSLSISLPVSCYGISSLILSSIFKLDFLKNSETGLLSIYKVFIGLAIAYLIVGVLNWVSSVIVTIEKEVLFDKLLSGEMEQSEPQQQQQQELGEPDEETSLLNSEFLEPLDHQIKLKRFLQDPSCKLFYLALFLLIGPLELYINNLGSLADVIGNNDIDIALQVSIFSIFSTCSRLGFGALSDFFNGGKATFYFILFSVLLAFTSFTLIAFNFQIIEISTALIGISYGSLFTMCPTLVATIWGVDFLGTSWGFFLSAPAVGSLICGLFYAYEYDNYCLVSSVSTGVGELFGGLYCLSRPFGVFIGFAFISGGLIFSCWRTKWSKMTL